MKQNSKKKNKYELTVGKFFGHLHNVNKHRFKVFCLCCRAGIPWRGFIHDLSKYSPTEFLESARYYVKGYSPIVNCKKDKGYSEAWLHHKGRNRHHYEYWYDYTASCEVPIIPYKYLVEMVCDTLAAGLTYQGKKWTKDYQLNYWFKTRNTAKIHPKIDFLLTRIYTEVSEQGIEKTINRKNMEYLYRKYIGKSK